VPASVPELDVLARAPSDPPAQAGAPSADEPPLNPNADAARVAAILERQQTRWEAQVSVLMAIICLIPIAMIVAIVPALGWELAVTLIATCVVCASYFGIVAFKLRDTTPRYLPIVRLVNMTIECSFATFAILLVTRVKGAEFAMSGSAVFIYVLAQCGAAARMRPALCLYATAMAIAQYLLVYHLLLAPRIDAAAVESLATLGAWNAWQRAFWFLMCGAVLAFGTWKAREWARFGGVQAMERRWLEKEFGRFVSRDVAGAVLRGEAGRAERRQVTVLFCDLRDFTAICERERPEDVVKLLNRFFERACAIIEGHGGTVNKFLGDGILALFGAPHEHPTHARAAAEAAHELLAAADSLRRHGGIWSGFEIGVGLDTGDVVVGAIGAPDRVEYTAIGATVNRAARLQSLAGRAGRRIILSRATAATLGPRANLVSLGDVSLKGFSAPEPAYAFRHS
jgi:class 3 adenylate cyclase